MVKVEEKLYPDVPPTKVRGREETFKEAKTSKFWLWVADMFFCNMLRNRFCTFRYSGTENYYNSNSQETPTIIFSQHCNWWDGIVMYHICNKIFKREIRLMVEELNRFPLLRRGGAFSVNKKSPQSAMKAIKYAVNEAGKLSNILAIFPQGIIRPPHFRPIEFQTGLAYMAQSAVKKYGKVNLLPIAVDYTFLRDNRPEVIVSVGEAIVLTNAKQDRHELTHQLERALEKTCIEQEEKISKGQLDDFNILFKQHLKWYRQIEQRLKRIEVPKESN